MKPLLLLALLSQIANAELVPVAVPGSPLSFSAPADWQIMLQPPQSRHMPLILRLEQDCQQGARSQAEKYDVQVQLDERSSPAAVVRDVYPRAQLRTISGWTCHQQSQQEVMCAHHVSGLRGVVMVTLWAYSAAAFGEIGGVDFLLSLAQSLRWKGGSPARIPEWDRAGVVVTCR